MPYFTDNPLLTYIFFTIFLGYSKNYVYLCSIIVLTNIKYRRLEVYEYK